jgi:hypothetical protein
MELYEDFETDLDEDLDDTPAWMKEKDGITRRVFMTSPIEESMRPPRGLVKIELMYGNSRGHKTSIFDFTKKIEPTEIAIFKCLFIEDD